MYHCARSSKNLLVVSAPWCRVCDQENFLYALLQVSFGNSDVAEDRRPAIEIYDDVNRKVFRASRKALRWVK